jgi:hypothetical protein
MPEMKVVLPQLMQNPKRFCGNLPKIYSFDRVLFSTNQHKFNKHDSNAYFRGWSRTSANKLGPLPCFWKIF